MARLTSEPGTNPYAASFLSVGPDLDLFSTGDNSPIELQQGVWYNMDFITICVSNTTIAQPLTWQLVVRDPRNNIDDVNEGYVIAAVGGVSSDIPGQRRKSPTGDAGPYLHNPLQFDLRGLPRLANSKLYLVLLTDPTTSAFVESIRGVESKPI